MPGLSLKESFELRLDEFVDTVRVPSRERDVCCNCLESVKSKSVDDASASSTGSPELEEERYNTTYTSHFALANTILSTRKQSSPPVDCQVCPALAT